MLDIGCGVGDVSFIATQLVGETGQVVGIDRSQAAIDTARERARFGGHKNVDFLVGDVTDPQVPGKFDAIVGRLVLMYLPDPAGGAGSPAQCAAVAGADRDAGGRPHHRSAREPEVPLITQLREWFVAGFARVGAATQMGSRLCSVMHRAGFSPEGSWVSQPSYVGPHLTAARLVLGSRADDVADRSSANGITTAAGVDLPTLAARLQAEARARDAIVFAPRLVGVWARHST